MQNNPVGWFEIYVEEIDRAQQFYEAVLGTQLSVLEEPEEAGGPEVLMRAFPMAEGAPGAAGALAKMDGMSPGGNSVLVYFSCEDCAIEAGRVTAAGGRLEKEKMSIGEYGFIALAYDTEGNIFGLHSTK